MKKRILLSVAASGVLAAAPTPVFAVTSCESQYLIDVQNCGSNADCAAVAYANLVLCQEANGAPCDPNADCRNEDP